jgi:von Willebrand factor type A domain
MSIPSMYGVRSLVPALPARPVLLVLTLLLLDASRAFADTLSSSRYEAKEQSHRIDVLVDRGFATLVVRRTVVNTGPKSDQALFSIDVPGGAVATRLRTSGVDAAGKPVWFEGDLMDAEAAAAKYRELTGFGGYYPKDPALLSWRSQGTLALQVFPVPPEASKTVEYTLEVPMRYEAGTYRMDLPALGTEDMPAVVRASAARHEDLLRVNGVLATGASIKASQSIVLELQPAADGLAAALAQVVLGPGRVLFHGHVDAPPRLGEVPAHAAIAIVLDTSRSMGDDLPAAMAAARAYLRSFTAGAKVTLVTFDRHIATPLGTARPVAEAIARMQAFSPTPQNGSQVDAAIALADAVLARSASPARRMLVLTDLLTRHALTPQRLAATVLKSGSTVHVATIAQGETSSLTRDDDDAWSAFPRKTGGVFWHASALEGDRAEEHVFEEWARPKRVDHLKVTGFPNDFAPPEVLDEGSGLEDLAIAHARIERIAVEGEIWSRPVTLAVPSSPAEERRWSALVFGSPLLGELTEPEQRVLAMRGRAVSPVTSYLAIEPGVRPSIDGFEDESQGVGEGVALGGLGGIGSGTGGGGSSGHWPDPQDFLDRELARAWSRCGGAGTATIDLESTRTEVVDVGGVTASNENAKAATCLQEAAWALDLPPSFAAPHADWSTRVTASVACGMDATRASICSRGPPPAAYGARVILPLAWRWASANVPSSMPEGGCRTSRRWPVGSRPTTTRTTGS